MCGSEQRIHTKIPVTWVNLVCLSLQRSPRRNVNRPHTLTHFFAPTSRTDMHIYHAWHNARPRSTITGAASDRSRRARLPPPRTWHAQAKTYPAHDSNVFHSPSLVCLHVEGGGMNPTRSPSGSRTDKRTSMSESILVDPSILVPWASRWICAYDSCKERLKEKVGSTVSANAGLLRPRKSSTHNPAIWQYIHA